MASIFLVSDGSQAMEEVCAALHAGGYKLMRHVGLTVDLEGEEGLRALLSQLGVCSETVGAALPVIVAECSRRAKRFRFEQDRIARPCPETLARFVAQKRAPLPDLSVAAAPPTLVQPSGGRWPTKHHAALAKTADDEERRTLEAKERKRQQEALAGDTLASFAHCRYVEGLG